MSPHMERAKDVTEQCMEQYPFDVGVGLLVCVLKKNHDGNHLSSDWFEPQLKWPKVVA